jgi:hypothetical protein
MASLEKAWTGSAGLMYYGNLLLFSDRWDVTIAQDIIDISNISAYINALGLPSPEDSAGNGGNPALPFPENQPDPLKPWDRKSTNNIPTKQSQYGTARINLDGGMRMATIEISGLCATYQPDQNYFPRISNYVYIQLSNSIDPTKTVFNFPICIVKEVSLSFDIKNYQRWRMVAVTTGEFDVFPGVDPA